MLFALWKFCSFIKLRMEEIHNGRKEGKMKESII
jgi:hypothetical protein